MLNIPKLSESTKGWSTKLTQVKWGDKEVKYDIRAWNKDFTHMGKGITLTEDELVKLYIILKNEVDKLVK